VRKGVFGLSRNPIFLGMISTLLGLFLVIPNAVTQLACVLGVVLIQTGEARRGVPVGGARR
jgi:protein-S-isoprenylcysteine O-methyltransferase Ste14